MCMYIDIHTSMSDVHIYYSILLAMGLVSVETLNRSLQLWMQISL